MSTFAAFEAHPHAGQPVRLYEFDLGALQRWRYCTADRDLRDAAGRTWTAEPIEDDGIRATGQASADTLTLTASAHLGAVAHWRHAPPTEEMFLTVRDAHAPLGAQGEPVTLTPELMQVVWVGSVAAVRFATAPACEIVAESLSATMRRPGLRLAWQRECPHSLYDMHCRADERAHTYAARVVDADGLNITTDVAARGIFSGGIVRWRDAAGFTQQRGIGLELDGAKLQILGGTAGLASGQAVQLLAGCDQSRACCQARFGNLDNYGGFAHMPGKSPFDGTPAF